MEGASTSQSAIEPSEPQSELIKEFDAAMTGQQEEQPSTAGSSDPASATAQGPSEETSEVPHVRSLAWRNFEQALKEITPSASEALGSLAELRKWNDEFGEGRRAKKRQVWGKDRFGFTVPALEIVPSDGVPGSGIVTPASPSPGPTVTDSATGR